MSLAYVITGYHVPTHMARLVGRLRHGDDVVLVHIDRKVDAEPFRQALAPWLADGSVSFVEPRVTCHWGSFGVVEATLRGARRALGTGNPFTHLVLLTGQDYPVKPLDEIRRFLEDRRGRTLMSWSAGEGEALPDHERIGNPFWPWNGDTTRMESRHYWIRGRKVVVPNRFIRFPRTHKIPRDLEPRMGLAYAALSREAVEWVLSFLRQRRDVRRFFKRVFIPDEFFFQTLLLASPLADRITNEDLHWMIWDGWHPAILREQHVDSMISSSKLFARKFDSDHSRAALDMLDWKLGYAEPEAAPGVHLT